MGSILCVLGIGEGSAEEVKVDRSTSTWVGCKDGAQATSQNLFVSEVTRPIVALGARYKEHSLPYVYHPQISIPEPYSPEPAAPFFVWIRRRLWSRLFA